MFKDHVFAAKSFASLVDVSNTPAVVSIDVTMKFRLHSALVSVLILWQFKEGP